VNDDELLVIAEEEDNPESLCRKLLDTVLRRGAHDNTTIISIFLSDLERSKNAKPGKIGQFFADSIINLQKMVKIFR
jgi:serine/threonine protein phosphatase PrpC